MGGISSGSAWISSVCSRTAGISRTAKLLRSEEELEPPPEDVAGRLGLLGGDVVGDRIVELGVIPIEDHLDVLRHMPIQSDIGHPEAVGIPPGVRQAEAIDGRADVHVIIAPEELPGP